MFNQSLALLAQSELSSFCFLVLVLFAGVLRSFCTQKMVLSSYSPFKSKLNQCFPKMQYTINLPLSYSESMLSNAGFKITLSRRDVSCPRPFLCFFPPLSLPPPTFWKYWACPEAILKSSALKLTLHSIRAWKVVRWEMSKMWKCQKGFIAEWNSNAYILWKLRRAL